MRKTYHGSCHCGAVRFACELDLAAGTSKCNLDEIGDFFGVNLACLDDATAGELSRAPVRYEDRRHDNWESEISEIQRRVL